MSDNPFWGGTIRKLLPTEMEKFRDHLLRMDRASRQLRFTHAVSDSVIEDYARRMNDAGAIAYAYMLDGEARAAAELRPVGNSWSPTAEAAFSVEPAFQNRGLGTELMGRIIRAAKNRSVQRLVINCLIGNAKMQSIARKFEAELRFEHGDAVGEITPAQANYFSIVAEAMEDSIGGMLSILDYQQRTLAASG